MSATETIQSATDMRRAHALHALVGHFAPVPLDKSDECAGCGNEKRHRGKPASSLVCCRDCWERLPKWAKAGFMHDSRRPDCGPEHGATIWQHRLSILLQWMRDADNMPNVRMSEGADK